MEVEESEGYSIADEEDTGGNRDNLVESVGRVNAANYHDGALYVDMELNEITIIREQPKETPTNTDSWILDDSLDSIPRINNRNDGEGKEETEDSEEQKTNIFASQDDVWLKVKKALDKRWNLHTSSFSILAVGGTGSGKSYTLFGECGNDGSQRGVLPRFIEYAFHHNIRKHRDHQHDHHGHNHDNQDVNDESHNLHGHSHHSSNHAHGWGATYVLVNAYLIQEEQLVDLLNPPSVYSYQGAVCYSDHLGPLALPLQTVLATGATQCVEIARLALQVGATLLANSTDFYTGAHIVFNFRVISVPSNRIITVTFAEVASLTCPEMALPAIDRLSGTSFAHTSTRTLIESVRGAKKDAVWSSSSPANGSTEPKYKASLLTYLLQDDLFKAPDCYIIGCIRGHKAAFWDNFAALDFLNRLDLSSSSSAEEVSRSSDLSTVADGVQEEICQLLLQLDNIRKRETLEKRKMIQAEQAKEKEKEKEIKKDDTDGVKRQPQKKDVSSKDKDASRSRESPPHGKNQPIPLTCLLEEKLSHLGLYAQTLKTMLTYNELDESGKRSAIEYLNDEFNIHHKLEEVARKKSELAVVLIKGKGTLPNKFKSKPKPAKNVNSAVRGKANKEAEQVEQSVSDFLIKWLLDRGIFAYTTFIDRSIASLGREIDETRIKQEQWGDPQFGDQDPFLEVICPSNFTASYARIKIRRGFTSVKGYDSILLEYRQSTANDKEKGISSSFSHGSRDAKLYSQAERKKVDELFSRDLNLLLNPNSVGDDVESKNKDNVDDDDLDGGLESVSTSQSKTVSNNNEVENTNAIPLIKVSGAGLCPLHCLFWEEYDIVKIRPFIDDETDKPSLIVVNGREVTTEMKLIDKDVIQLGHSRFFRLRIPRREVQLDEAISHGHELRTEVVGIGRDHRNKLTVWEQSMLKQFMSTFKSAIFDCEIHRRQLAHLAVEREKAAVAKMSDRTPLMNLETFDPPEEDVDLIASAISHLDKAKFCEHIGATALCNHWALIMRKNVQSEFSLRVATHAEISEKEKEKDREKERFIAISKEMPVSIPFIPPDNHSSLSSPSSSSPIFFYIGSILFNETIATGSWWWPFDVFKERFALMRQMREDFGGCWCQRDPMWLEKLYTEDQDTFKDTLQDELIGVGFLFLDSVQYLLDIDDMIPIINAEGSNAGYIKLRTRAWLDDIETIPAYLSVDKESHVRDFINRKLILVFYLENLLSLPKKLCASTYIYFKFFCHNQGYRTSRHGGLAINPNISSIIRVEQRITRDFEEYLRSGSIELEVFGKQRKPLGIVPPISLSLALGEPSLKAEIAEEEEPMESDQGNAAADTVGELSGAGEGSGNGNGEGKGEEQLKQRLAEVTAALENSERQLTHAKKVAEKSHSELANLHKEVEKKAAIALAAEKRLAQLEEEIKLRDGNGKNGDAGKLGKSNSTKQSHPSKKGGVPSGEKQEGSSVCVLS